MKGAIAMQNEVAPAGWVEIQRDDEAGVFADDLDAALACCTRAGIHWPADAVRQSAEPVCGGYRVFVPVFVAYVCGMVNAQQALEATRGVT